MLSGSFKSETTGLARPLPLSRGFCTVKASIMVVDLRRIDKMSLISRGAGWVNSVDTLE